MYAYFYQLMCDILSLTWLVLICMHVTSVKIVFLFLFLSRKYTVPILSHLHLVGLMILAQHDNVYSCFCFFPVHYGRVCVCMRV